MAEKVQLEARRGPGKPASRQASVVSGGRDIHHFPERRSSQDGAGTQLLPRFPAGERLAQHQLVSQRNERDCPHLQAESGVHLAPRKTGGSRRGYSLNAHEEIRPRPHLCSPSTGEGAGC